MNGFWLPEKCYKIFPHTTRNSKSKNDIEGYLFILLFD